MKKELCRLWLLVWHFFGDLYAPVQIFLLAVLLLPLSRLKEAGALTQEEFDEWKVRLLRSLMSPQGRAFAILLGAYIIYTRFL